MVALSLRNPREFAGRLDEVNDRGIIMTLSAGSVNQVEAFYPWNSIRRIRLRSKKEESEARKGSEPGSRLPGDPGWFS